MVLCFDIGGTAIKFGAACEKDGKIDFVYRNEVPTNAKEDGGPGIVSRVEALISQMKDTFDTEGIAISTAGVVDSQRGKIIYANENIPNYTGWNWKTFINDRFGLPCSVENDVNCAALGETVYGTGRGADSVLCITVGTGVGGAVVLNKKIWHGHGGTAGEIGYMRINGIPLEKLGSASALVKRVEAESGKVLNGKQIFALAKEGDAICRNAIEKMCAALAEGIASSCCLLDPEKVILGGGVMAQKEYLAPIIKSHLDKCVDEATGENFTVEFAKLGNMAGMAGAYYISTCS